MVNNYLKLYLDLGNPNIMRRFYELEEHVQPLMIKVRTKALDGPTHVAIFTFKEGEGYQLSRLIRSYFEFSRRALWQPSEHFEAALVGETGHAAAN